MIGRPEYTLTLPPPCPTNRDDLTYTGCSNASPLGPRHRVPGRSPATLQTIPRAKHACPLSKTVSYTRFSAFQSPR